MGAIVFPFVGATLVFVSLVRQPGELLRSFYANVLELGTSSDIENTMG